MNPRFMRYIGLASNVGVPLLYAGLAWLLGGKDIVLWKWMGGAVREETIFGFSLIFAGLCGLGMWFWARAIQKMELGSQRWPGLLWLAAGEAVAFLCIVYVLLGGSALRSLAFPLLTLGFFFSFAPGVLKGPPARPRD